MPYGLIVLFASIALVANFNFATKASLVSKTAVSGIFLLALACFLGWIPGGSLAGLFLMVALSLFLILHRAWQRARTGKND
jgi:hypothetical protein